MSWADLEWYLALLPVGLWASYIMPLGFHSLVNEMGVMPAFQLLVPRHSYTQHDIEEGETEQVYRVI